MSKVLLPVVLGLWASTGLAQQVGLVLKLSTERFSDPLPLKALMANDLAQASPRGDHNLIYLRDEVRLGARWKAGDLSVIVRQSATLVANEGAVVVIKDLSTPGGPPASYDQRVKLHMVGFVGAGLAFDSEGLLPVDRWGWQAGVQVLSLRRYVARDLEGQASYDAASRIYGLQARSTYVDDRLTFPFQQTFDSSGLGVLFSGGLRWRATDQLSLSWRVDDLGRLQWSGLPQDDMVLSTNTSQVDGDGYLVYRPLINGHYRQNRYTAKSVATWTVGGEWGFSPSWTAVGQLRRVDGFNRALPYTGVRWVSGRWQASAGWLWHERALSLGASHGPWQLAVSGDRLDAGAHARMVSLRWAGTLD